MSCLNYDFSSICDSVRIHCAVNNPKVARDAFTRLSICLKNVTEYKWFYCVPPLDKKNGVNSTQHFFQCICDISMASLYNCSQFWCEFFSCTFVLISWVAMVAYGMITITGPSVYVVVSVVVAYQMCICLDVDIKQMPCNSILSLPNSVEHELVWLHVPNIWVQWGPILWRTLQIWGT